LAAINYYNIKMIKMKKSLLYILLVVTVLAGCDKNDGPVPDDVKLERVPEPQIVKNGGSAAIDVTNLSSFQGKFDVGLYFPNDVKPSKMDVVIRKNNSAVKVFQTDVATFPTTFTITSAQLATLFGAPVALNDNYDIGADVYTQDGKKYEAFPATGVGYASGIASQPGATTTTRYSAICQYNPDTYQGDFEVVEDAWADYVAGDVIVLTKIDATHFSFKHVAAVNAVPIIITVNAANNVASVANQSVGTRWAYGTQYTAPFVVTAGAASSSFVAPCDKTLTLNLNYGYSAGTFGGGPYPLVIKKK
jgi:hypothetical protein